MVYLAGVERVEVFWGVVRLTTNKATEEGSDDGLRDDDLAVNLSPLKMKKFHAN